MTYKHMFILLLLLFSSFSQLFATDLSDEEREWLINHSRIRYAPAPNYPPIEFFDDDGHFTGLTSDFLQLISERYGINFEIVKYDTWNEVVADTIERRVDLWGCAAKNEERLEYMSFPEPYIYFPSVIVVRNHDKADYTLDELDQKRIVVVNNYATHRFMEKHYPYYNYVIVPDIVTGLRIVSIGTADAIIVTNAAASYYSEISGINNLRVAGVVDETELDLNLGFAVRNDWPELKSIIQKALDSMTETEKKEIFRKWISLTPSRWFLTKTQLIIIGVGFFCLLFLSVLIWSITLKKQVESKTRELGIASREFSLIFRNTPVGILYIVDRIIKQCNPAVFNFSGYTAGELYGTASRIFFLNDQDYIHIEKSYRKKLEEGKTFSTELRLKKKNGKIVWCNIIGQAVNPLNIHEGVIWIISDVSARKELQDSLIRQANTDVLTGIHNRRSFEKLAEKEFRRSRRKGWPVSILMIDIDHFKNVNESCGHDGGDKALKFFSDITSAMVREYDIFARIGGEEFVLFMPDTDSSTSLKIAERIRQAIEVQKLIIIDQEIAFTVSIGISFCEGDWDKIGLQDLMKQADQALYQAKRDRRNLVRKYGD